jgi:hypothetical protein
MCQLESFGKMKCPAEVGAHSHTEKRHGQIPLRPEGHLCRGFPGYPDFVFGGQSIRFPFDNSDRPFESLILNELGPDARNRKQQLLPWAAPETEGHGGIHAGQTSQQRCEIAFSIQPLFFRHSRPHRVALPRAAPKK